MATFQVNPVELISAPNFYSYLPDRQWIITHGMAAALAGQIFISDQLGTRRYVLPNTASLKVTFLRADSPQNPSQAQTVQKTVSLNGQDRSLFTFTLTAQESQLVISGSVIYDLIDTNPSGVTTQWVINYGIKKLVVGPGF